MPTWPVTPDRDAHERPRSSRPHQRRCLQPCGKHSTRGETDRTLLQRRTRGLLVRLTPRHVRTGRQPTRTRRRGHDTCCWRGPPWPTQQGGWPSPASPRPPSTASPCTEPDLDDRAHLYASTPAPPARLPVVNHHRDPAVTIEEDRGHVPRAWWPSDPARAVWEVACRSSLEGGVVTADSAPRERSRARHDRIDDWPTASPDFPGSCHGATALRWPRPSESPGESVTRVQFHRYGIPMPELQYKVFDERGELVGDRGLLLGAISPPRRVRRQGQVPEVSPAGRVTLRLRVPGEAPRGPHAGRIPRDDRFVWST